MPDRERRMVIAEGYKTSGFLISCLGQRFGEVSRQGCNKNKCETGGSEGCFQSNLVDVFSLLLFSRVWIGADGYIYVPNENEATRYLRKGWIFFLFRVECPLPAHLFER